MKKIILQAGLFLFCTSLCAQSVELRLTLRDGNVMSGTSQIGTVTLSTDYGRLDIPVKNVSSIDIGITPDKAEEGKVINLLKQLSNSSEEMRKNAYEELVKMDARAIPVVNNFISSAAYTSSTYTDYTAENALTDLMTANNVESNFSDKDIVNIDYSYTMGGIYDFKKLDLKTTYGTLSIPKEKIQHIDVMYTGSSEGEKVFKLLASKHISGNTNGGWLKTGIMVKQGQQMKLNATGEIMLASLSNNKYHPDGSTGTTGTTSYEGESDYNYDSGTTYPVYGNVVYKIGETSTQPLKAGAKFSGKAAASGMLYLAIYETVFNASNTGSYTVKLSIK